MDISGLATRDNAESGIWFTVELYGVERDFQLRIRGNDSDPVQKFTRDRLRKSLERPQGKKVTDADISEVLELDEGNVLSRIAGIRGVKRDKKGEIVSYDDPVSLLGRELGDKEEDYRFLIEKIPAIKDFVLKISNDRACFLEGGKKS
jgi:hypothetical protein